MNWTKQTPWKEPFPSHISILKSLWKRKKCNHFYTKCSIERIVQTVGRRKTAVANVTIINNSNHIRINGYSAKEFFIGEYINPITINRPFCVLSYLNLGVLSNIKGGGVKCQFTALQLAVARAIIIILPSSHRFFRKYDFITCISRKKERRKYGLKKARKAPQFSKRLE
jgi:small subunit ribosomal protein S9